MEEVEVEDERGRGGELGEVEVEEESGEGKWRGLEKESARGKEEEEGERGKRRGVGRSGTGGEEYTGVGYIINWSSSLQELLQ